MNEIETENIIQSIIQQANKIKDIETIKGKSQWYIRVPVTNYLECKDDYTNKLLPIEIIVDNIEEDLYESQVIQDLIDDLS